MKKIMLPFATILLFSLATLPKQQLPLIPLPARKELKAHPRPCSKLPAMTPA